MGPVAPPVFVVGAPRSGGALLYRLLCLHPDSFWASTWMRHAAASAPFAMLHRVSARTSRRRPKPWFRTGFDAPPGARARRRYRRGLLPRPADGEELFAAHDLDAVSDSEPPTRRQAGLRRAVASLARSVDGRVFVNHHPEHTRRIPQLRTLFPDARIVVPTRDGRAVAASLRHADWWPESAAESDPWELAATHWVREVEALESGLAGVPTDQVLQIRYEDLVADPQDTLDRVGEFAGLAPGRPSRRALARVRLAQHADDGWPGRLGDAAERVQAIQEGWLRKYGYLD
ncbi:MAG: sulfotransferase family protein [Streptosporangiales bacterium]